MVRVRGVPVGVQKTELIARGLQLVVYPAELSADQKREPILDPLLAGNVQGLFAVLPDSLGIHKTAPSLQRDPYLKSKEKHLFQGPAPSPDGRTLDFIPKVTCVFKKSLSLVKSDVCLTKNTFVDFQKVTFF